MKKPTKPKVALVYDRVNTPYGGAEQVLLALHEVFPKAPLFTSVYDLSRAHWAKSFKIRASFLQFLPGTKNLHRWLAPLMPLAFESLDLSEYDIVISITSAEAKGINTKPNQLHICYLLTPTRYLYSHRQSYLKSLPNLPGLKFLANKFLDYLTWWDQMAKDKPDVIIPISRLVQNRTKKYYQRETEEVIYPPVENRDQFKPNQTNKLELPKDFYLVVSRLVPYKKIDLAIKACQKLGKNLVIVGEGPQKSKLEELAQNPSQSKIIFLGNVNPSNLNQVMLQAKALLMPGLEDFGITALDALAYQKPVIIHSKSGVAELIKNGDTGIHLTQLTTQSLIGAINKLEKTRFKTAIMSGIVSGYDTASFKRKFKSVVAKHWRKHYGKQ